MIPSVITASILQSKASTRNVKKIANAAYAIQLDIYRETLNDLDDYLDTSDLRKLTAKSLKVIRDDILQIIAGSRDMRGKIPPGSVKSLDGALEELRLARDAMQVALGMFNLVGQFNENKSKKMFAEMRTARKQIEKALKMLNFK